LFSLYFSLCRGAPSAAAGLRQVAWLCLVPPGPFQYFFFPLRGFEQAFNPAISHKTACKINKR
jgi:hypothetical protein